MKRFKDTKYLVGENGEVYSEKTKKFIKPFFHKKTGYFYINLGAKFRESIHRLVARVYLGEDNLSLDVNHIDGNKLNNNYVNLEWCTRSKNCQHSYDTGLSKKRFGHTDSQGSKNHLAKVNEELVKEIRTKYATGNYTYQQIADDLNVNQATIGYIVTRHTWKHVE